MDFCIIGKFFLRPSFPYKNHRIHSRPRRYAADTRPVTIQALFTDGNVRDAKVSFLPPEERQMFKAEVIYAGRAQRLLQTDEQNHPVEKEASNRPNGGRDERPARAF